MKYDIIIRKKQCLLPRYDTGGDWGVERKLLATHPYGRKLIWWTGHTTWIMVGQSGHVPGELSVQTGFSTIRSLDYKKAGSTRLVQVLKSEAGRAFIRELFIDDDDVIAALDPRGTIDIKLKGTK